MKYRLGFAACFVMAHVVPVDGKARPTTPEAFVRDLRKNYGKDDRPDLLGKVAPEYFAPRRLDLIRADERVLPGDVRRLDEDPLCDCQDDGGFRLSSIVTDRLSSDRATATTHMIIDVVPVVIHDRSLRSLVSFLSSRSPR